MKVIKELTMIASMVEQIESLSHMLEFDDDLGLSIDDLQLKDSYFIYGCEEINGHLFINRSQLDNGGLVDDIYYIWQKAGYCEDDFYGKRCISRQMYLVNS